MEEFGVSFLNKDVGTMDRKELVNYLSMYLSNALNYKEVVKAKERKKQAILAEAESTLRATEENYKKYASLELTKSQREVRPQITALMEKIEQQEPYPVKWLLLLVTGITGVIFIALNYLIKIWVDFEMRRFGERVALFDRSPETAGAWFRMDLVRLIFNWWESNYVVAFIVLVVAIILFIKVREGAKVKRLEQKIVKLREEAAEADQKRVAGRNLEEEFGLAEKRQEIDECRNHALDQLKELTLVPITQSLSTHDQLRPVLPPSMQTDDLDTLKRLSYIYQILEDQRASSWEHAFQILREEERHQENSELMKKGFLMLNDRLMEADNQLANLNAMTAKNNQQTKELLHEIKRLPVVFY